MGTQKKINKIANGGRSAWSKDADFRLKNRKWLRYSSNIARRILAAIEDKQDGDTKMNQSALAILIGVKPQYISKVVKGRENLSLETIAKISEALGIELIAFPPYKDSAAQQSAKVVNRIMFLSDEYRTLSKEQFEKIREIVADPSKSYGVSEKIANTSQFSEFPKFLTIPNG